MRPKLLFALTTGVLVFGGLAGAPLIHAQTEHPQASQPKVVEQVRKTAAVLEEVDPQARQVLLRLPDDTLVTLRVAKNVNLAGLRPGDHVNVDYVQARLVGVGPARGHSGALQSIAGGGPNGTSQGDTTIVAVDPTAHTVSFVGPNNVVQTIHVAGNAMIEAVTKLQPGQRAEVAYIPGMAVAIRHL